MDAEQQGLTVSPIGRFAIKPLALNGLVLGYGSVPPAAIETGVATLARVLESRRRTLQAA